MTEPIRQAVGGGLMNLAVGVILLGVFTPMFQQKPALPFAISIFAGIGVGLVIALGSIVVLKRGEVQ